MKILPALLLALWLPSVQAQAYGPNIDSAQAHQVMQAALAEAKRQNLRLAIAIVDTGGQLVLFERMDEAQHGAGPVAQDKAASAALFKAPTALFQEILAKDPGATRLLAVRGLVPVSGGHPLIAQGKVVGGVGVSGALPDQDGRVAKVAAEALER